MTIYATHRFSVGLQVACPGKNPDLYQVMVEIDGTDGPRYEIRSSDGGFRSVVAERELTYSTAQLSAGHLANLSTPQRGDADG